MCCCSCREKKVASTTQDANPNQVSGSRHGKWREAREPPPAAHRQITDERPYP